MPKVTFFNLPENKKKTLIDAARKEFSRVPLSKASIANIVKLAGIPRGSFYQYFEDKEDAFFYLLEQLVKELNDHSMSILQKNDGDLFETMIEFYKFIIQEEEHYTFLKNTFLNMNHQVEDIFSKSFSDHVEQGEYPVFGSTINRSQLNISDENDLHHVMKIISAVTFHNFIEKFSKDLSYEEAVYQYEKEIQLLKKGLFRNE